MKPMFDYFLPHDKTTKEPAEGNRVGRGSRLSSRWPQNSAYAQCVEDHFEDFERVYFA
jgi:hypothetical protein